MMHCLDVRRELATTPAALSTGARAHLRQCPRCAALAADALRQEARLRRAMEVPVPEGLEQRVLLRQRLQHRRGRRRAVRWALAAGVLLAVAAAWQLRPVPVEQRVVAAVADYLSARAGALAVPVDGSLDPASLDAVTRPFGLQLGEGVGPVREVRPCVIRDRQGLYLVMDGEKGPVVVLVLPEERVERRVRFQVDGRHGLLVPCPRGGLAIIGQPGERLAALEQRLQRASRWL